MILYFFAFLSGLVTILAPCIWPLLPIILSASTTGGNKKPLGITLGISLSFGLLTLFLSYLLKIIPFDPNLLRVLSIAIIGLLGLSLIIPEISSYLEAKVSSLSGRFMIKSGSNDGFISGFLIGLSLGVVWTPCAGPILAVIATLAATQAVNFQTMILTAVYITGVAIPLFIFSTLGSKIFTKSRLVSPYLGKIQQIFGVIMIITALGIYLNLDKTVENKLLDLFPSYSQFIENVGNNPAVGSQLNTAIGQTSNPIDQSKLLNSNYKASEFTGITKWLNTSDNLTLEKLKGKVVLVDFWTYTCINCIRTLPHLTSWYQKYKDSGLVIVGIHTPEFEFEKDTGNVQNALKQYQITYPVGQDNNYSTWKAFNNQYWPAEYLIDSKGVVRRTHFGEGEYDQTEQAIQLLLSQAGESVNQSLDSMPDQTPQNQISPETYLGNERMEYYYPDQNLPIGTNNYNLVDKVPVNNFSLGGEWNITDSAGIPSTGSTLNYHFYAGHVYLVLKLSSGTPTHIKVYLDNNVIDPAVSGVDVKDGVLTTDADRLYSIVDLNGKTEDHTLKLEFDSSVQLYTFTFG